MDLESIRAAHQALYQASPSSLSPDLMVHDQ